VAAVEKANAAGVVIDAATIRGVDIMGSIKNVFFHGSNGERLEFFEYA